MFPCCGKGSDAAELESVFVLSVTVRRETMSMEVRALFPSMPAPTTVSAH